MHSESNYPYNLLVIEAPVSRVSSLWNYFLGNKVTPKVSPYTLRDPKNGGNPKN